MADKLKRIFVVCSDSWKEYEINPSNSVDVWHSEADLSDDGKNAMKHLYDAHLAEIYFQLYGSSLLTRAFQAIKILANGNHVFKFGELGPVSSKAWNLWHRIDPKMLQGSFQEISRNAAASALLYTEGDHLFHFIKRMAERVKPGQNILLVSHKILIECAIAYSIGCWPPRENVSDRDVVIFYFGENKKFIKYERISSE